MTSEQPLLIGVSGFFSFIPFFQPFVSDEAFRIVPEPKPYLRHRVIIPVRLDSDSIRSFVAVSESVRPFAVVLYDVSSRQSQTTFLGHQFAASSLESFTYSPTSTRLITGGYGDSKVFVFDAKTGELCCTLPDPPPLTKSILVVPEWSRSTAYVGGCVRGQSFCSLFRYDLVQGMKEATMGMLDLGEVVHKVSTDVSEIAADVAHNVLYVADKDQIRVWSPHPHSLVRSFLGSSDWIHSMCYNEDKGLLCVGTGHGKVEFWDPRKTSSPVASFYVGGAPVNSIDRVDDERFVAGTEDRKLCVWTSKMADGEPVRLDAVRMSNSVSGVCVLRSEEKSKDSDATPTTGQRLEVLAATGCLSLGLRSAEETAMTSRCLLGDSPFVNEDSPEAILLDHPHSISAEELLVVLTGERPDPARLHDFYRLFCQLRLKKHAYVSCKEVELIQSIEVMEGLARECADSLDAFSQAMLRQMNRLAHAQMQEMADLYHGEFGRCCLLPRDDPFWDRNVSDHPDFGTLEDPADSFSSLFRSACTELLRSQFATNVTLRTCDGGEMQAHLEVLVARSNLFFRMLSFRGQEFSELQSSRSISVDHFSREELSCILHLIYTDTLPESALSDAGTLLGLLAHCGMYQEEQTMKTVQGELSDLILTTSPTDVTLLLLEYGWLVRTLPEELRDWFVGLCMMRKRLFAEADAECIIDVSHQIRDLHQEIARLNELLKGHQ